MTDAIRLLRPELAALPGAEGFLKGIETTAKMYDIWSLRFVCLNDSHTCC
jgi:hypothetical protein